MASRRLVLQDAAGASTAHDDKESHLCTASSELGSFFDCGYGLWEAGPGADADVEVEELFLVLSGKGEVAFSDGSVIELRPGTLVRLREGDETTWTITERIRKFYVTAPGDS